MTQLDTERHSFLAQRSRRPAHHLRNIYDRRFAFRLRFEFAQMLFRPRLTAVNLGFGLRLDLCFSFLRHHWFSYFTAGRLALKRQPRKYLDMDCQQENGLIWDNASIAACENRTRREILDARAINPLQYNSRAKQELLGFLGSLERFAYLIHQSTGLLLGALVLGSAGVDDHDG
jgi:hypothetical protein